MNDSESFGLDGKFKVEVFAASGELKFTETVDNLIVNEGLNEALESTLRTASTPTWYIGLTGSTPTVAPTDTMASHAGWVEVVDYSEANRQDYIPAAAAGQSITNSANQAVFTINATVTIGGAFLTSDNTKGGTTGKLFAGGAFNSGDRPVISGDVVRVTYTVSSSDV